MTDAPLPSNPYVALMYSRFGRLTPSEDVIVSHIVPVARLVAEATEALVIRISDHLRDNQEERPSAVVDRDVVLDDAVREQVLAGLLESIQVAQPVGERFAYLASAIRWASFDGHLMVADPPRQIPSGHALDEGFEDWLAGHFVVQKERVDGLGPESRAAGHGIAERLFFGYHDVASERRESPAPPHGEPQKASTWLRFFALTYDYLSALLLTCLFTLGLAIGGANVEEGGTVVLGYAVSFGWAVICALAIARWGTTPGKAVFGLGVIPDSSSGRLSVGRALVRETLGRFVNSVLWGIGYIVALGHPLRQTWADRLAGSRVIHTAIPAPVRWSLAVTGVTAFTGTLLFLGWGASLPDPDTQQRTIEAEGRSIGALSDSIAILMMRPVANPDEYKSDMLAALDAAAASETPLKQLRTHVRQSGKLRALFSQKDRAQLQAADSLFGLLQRKVALEKEVALLTLVGGFDDSGEPRYRRQIRYVQSDIDALEPERGRLLQLLEAEEK